MDLRNSQQNAGSNLHSGSIQSHNCLRRVRSLPLKNWKLPRDLGGLSGRVKSVVVSLVILVKVPSMYAVTNSLEAHVTLVQIHMQT